jgi:hypothetical protein
MIWIISYRPDLTLKCLGRNDQQRLEASSQLELTPSPPVRRRNGDNDRMGFLRAVLNAYHDSMRHGD